MLIRHRTAIASLLSFVIVISLAQPSDAVECTANVRLDARNNHLMTGELSATVGASEPYPRHRMANVDVGLFGIRSYALCDNTAASAAYLYVERTYGRFKLSNVVFSSEGSEPASVSLNLDLDGQFNLLEQTHNYALGRLVIEASINGTTFPGEIHVCTKNCVEVQLGLLDGVMGRSYPNVRLTTPQVVVPVNQPVTVQISMDIVIGVDSTPWARGEGVFDNSFSFARTGPVFNVPAGINVNSEHAVIVDNLYYSGNTVPVEPSSWGAIKALYR
jgi:hypothetical protein